MASEQENEETARIQTFKQISGEAVPKKRKKTTIVDNYEIPRGKVAEEVGLVDWVLDTAVDPNITEDNAMKLVGMGQYVESKLVANKGISADVLEVLMGSKDDLVVIDAVKNFAQKENAKLAKDKWFELYDRVARKETLTQRERDLANALFSGKIISGYDDEFLHNAMSEFIKTKTDAEATNGSSESVMNTIAQNIPKKYDCKTRTDMVKKSKSYRLHNTILMGADDECYCKLIMHPNVELVNLERIAIKLDTPCSCDIAHKIIEKKNFHLLANNIPEACADEITETMINEEDYVIRGLAAGNTTLPEELRCKILKKLSNDKTKHVRQIVGQNRKIPDSCSCGIYDRLLEKDKSDAATWIVGTLPTIPHDCRCNIAKKIITVGRYQGNQLIPYLGQDEDDCKCDIIESRLADERFSQFWENGNVKNIPEKCEERIFTKLLSDYDAYRYNGANIITGGKNLSNYDIIDHILSIEEEEVIHAGTIASYSNLISNSIPKDKIDDFYTRLEKVTKDRWQSYNNLKTQRGYYEWKKNKENEVKP